MKDKLLAHSNVVTYDNDLVKQELENWLHHSVLTTPKSKTWQKIARGFDTIMGLLASVMAIPLTYEFGELLIEQGLCQGVFHTLNCNRDAIETFKIYNTFVGTLSTAAILGKVANSLVEQILHQIPDHEKIIMTNDPRRLNVMLLHTLNWILAFASASPESYAAYRTLKGAFHAGVALFVVADVFTLTSKNNWAARNLSGQFLSNLKIKKWREAENHQKRLDLLEHLDGALENLARMTPDEVSHFFDKNLSIFSNDSDASREPTYEEISLSIKNIIHLGKSRNEFANPVTKSTCKNITGYLGSFLAIVGAAATYKLGQDGTQEFLQWIFHSSSKNIYGVSIALGITAYLYRIALGVYASKITFEKFYDWFGTFSCCQTTPAISDAEISVSDLLISVNSENINDKDIDINAINLTRNHSANQANTSYDIKILLLALAVLLISMGGGTPRVSMTALAYNNAAWYFVALCVTAFFAAFPTNYWAVDSIAQSVINRDPKRSHIQYGITQTRHGLFSIKQAHVDMLHKITLEDQAIESDATQQPGSVVPC